MEGSGIGSRLSAALAERLRGVVRVDEVWQDGRMRYCVRYWDFKEWVSWPTAPDEVQIEKAVRTIAARLKKQVDASLAMR
jgi:hypothetical protein